ncbi:Tox-REase-5 domain-containing protein, partial [Mycobacterium kansasii]
GEDFSVIDSRTSRSAAEQAARQAQAQAFAADIRQRVAQLLGVEHDVAGKITAATAGIAATTFPETPHDPKPRIQAVDNHTFKDSPQQPQPPDDPARMTPEQARAAYNQLKGEIRDHNSWRPPLDDASAVATYNREADALNARKGALEAQLGKTETVPAQGTRLVPDWAQPWQPPPHSPTPVPHGPGTWQPVTESMSDRAAQYQMQITGHPITEGYIVDGVKFDGFTDGALIEVKSYYDQFTENGHWKPWFTGEQGILNQAYNQIRVAGTTPIEWVFAQPETAALVEDLLTRNGYAINVIVVPPK